MTWERMTGMMQVPLWGVLLVLWLPGASCSRPKPTPPEPENLLVVLNKAGHSATVIDVDTGERKGTLVTGVAPHEAAGSSDMGIVVASNFGTNENAGFSLTVLDIRRMRVSRTIPLGRFRRPHGIQFFRDGARVAVTAEDSQAVLVVNIRTGEIEKAIPTTQRVSHLLVLSPDQERAYVANIHSGTISVLDIDKSSLVATLPLEEGVEGLDLSPDGSELWVANRLKNELTIIDTASLEVKDRLQCPGAPIRLCFTPDGQRVLVSNSRSGDIAVFSEPNRRLLTRIPMELSAEERAGRFSNLELNPVPVGIVVDSRGDRAYVANSNADLVTVIDTGNWSVVDRFPTGREPDGMALLHLLPPPPTQGQDSSSAAPSDH